MRQQGGGGSSRTWACKGQTGRSKQEKRDRSSRRGRWKRSGYEFFFDRLAKGVTLCTARPEKMYCKSRPSSAPPVGVPGTSPNEADFGGAFGLKKSVVAVLRGRTTDDWREIVGRWVAGGESRLTV